MNGPFVVAQANTGGSSATPVQVLKLIKPKAGETDIMHASFTGTVKIDFTAIANEKITLFHDSKNQSLHVIFADGSQIIIEPFFDSTRHHSRQPDLRDGAEPVLQRRAIRPDLYD